MFVLFKGVRGTVPLPPQYNLEQGSAILFLSPVLNTLGFLCHTVPVAATNSAMLA